MADWLAAIKANKKKTSKPSGKKKTKVFSFSGDDDETWGAPPDKWVAPQSQKEQAYLDMMARVEAMAKQAEEDYEYDPETDKFKPVAEGVVEDPGLTTQEIVRDTEEKEGTEGQHDLFGEGFGVDLKQRGKSHCSQYKTSRYSCEDAGCSYGERRNKDGTMSSFCRAKPTKKAGTTTTKKKVPSPSAATTPTKKASPSPKTPQKKLSSSDLPLKKRPVLMSPLPKTPAKKSPAKSPGKKTPGKATSSPKTPRSRCAQFKHSRDTCLSEGCVPAESLKHGMLCRAKPSSTSPRKSPNKSPVKKSSSSLPMANFIMPVGSAPPGMPTAMAQPMPGTYTMQALPSAPPMPSLRRR